MTVETADDLAAMFSTADFAVAATYRPAAGGSSTVAVLLAMPHERLDLGGAGVNAPRRELLVRVAEVAVPVRNDQVDVAGETLIVNVPRLDPSGLLWRLECRK